MHLDFKETPKKYIVNSIMCINGGVVAGFCYSFIAILATAATGSVAKIFQNLFLKDYSLSLCFFISVIVFMLGILLTIFIKSKFKTKKSQNIISLSIMIICYIALIFSYPFVKDSSNLELKIYWILPIFFSSSVQYNTFGFTDGVQIATMFATNNLRQTMIRLIEGGRNKDSEKIKTGLLYLFAIIFFIIGLCIGFGFFAYINVEILAISIALCFLCMLLQD